MGNDIGYHLAEFEIAQNPNDPRHLLPPKAAVGTRVLDIGCGAGQTLRAVYAECRAFGVDVDAAALRFGRDWNPAVRFAVARAEALPFRDALFETVVSRVALQYCEMGRSLGEIRRVTKPGGEVWLALQTAETCLAQAKAGGWKGWLFFLYILLNSLSFAWLGREFALGGRREMFQTTGGMRRALEKLGFERIAVERGRHFVVRARRGYAEEE